MPAYFANFLDEHREPPREECPHRCQTDAAVLEASDPPGHDEYAGIKRAAHEQRADGTDPQLVSATPTTTTPIQ
jgi:hypothetical protein